MQHLLLLHGAIGSASQLQPLVQALQNDFHIHTLDFDGHGGTPVPDEFTIKGFAQNVLDWLEANNLQQVDIFGYSMGGYVALYLAKSHPEKVGRIFTLATKFEWTPEIAQREIKMLDADKIAEKIPAFAEQLEKRHSPADWKLVLSKTAQMMVSLGDSNPLQPGDYKEIEIPVRIGIGDKDMMVTLEETIVVYRNLPNATFIVFPNTQHPVEKVSIERLARELQLFFS